MIVALRCPHCGHELQEEMPTDACLVRVSCPSCGAFITPRPGDCCVFCSYAVRRCPTAPPPEGS